MRKSAVLVFVALCAAHPALAKSIPLQSWGKPDVSLSEYRSDAVECGRMGYYADVSDTEQAKLFVKATRRLEAADDSAMLSIGADPYAHMVEVAARSEMIRTSIQPEKQMKELRAGMQYIVDSCLMERGYTRFVLTGEQRDELDHYKKGSPQRHAYLHSLASDPMVLRDQAADGALGQG